MFRGIREFLDRDATVTVDGENTMAMSRAAMPTYLPRHRLDAGTSGCMGVAVPYAIGAQIARPGKQVLSINGDWAFGFNGVEVETAARYNLPIVFLIANNGTTAGLQRQMAGGISGDDLSVVRYDKMMGALERAFAAGGTALVNVVIDPVARRKEQPFDWLERRGG